MLTDAVKDLKDTLDALFNHPNTGPFVSRQLIQRLITSNPSPGYVYRVAQAFANTRDVYVTERFYLGGQNFRGFDFRGISPRGIRNDTGTPGDDPVGGSWLFFLGAELNQPVYKDLLSIAPFIVRTQSTPAESSASASTQCRSSFVRASSRTPLVSKSIRCALAR